MHYFYAFQLLLVERCRCAVLVQVLRPIKAKRIQNNQALEICFEMIILHKATAIKMRRLAFDAMELLKSKRN